MMIHCLLEWPACSIPSQVLPLENKMKKPQNSKRVIYISMAVVTLLYVVFSVLGYMVYGNEIQSSITLSLQSDRLGAYV